MQSFLQYRSFGKAVRAQYDRDQTKASALMRGNQALGQPAVPQRDDSDASSTTIRGGEEHEEEKEEREEREDQDPELEHGLRNPSVSTLDGPIGQVMTNKTVATIPYEDDDHPDPELRDQIARIATIRTMYSESTALGIALTGIHVRDRSTRDGGSGQVFVVGYESEADPLNPQNWSLARKFSITMMVAGIAFVVGIASSIDASAIPQAAEEFGVSQVVEAIATGFGTGGLLSGPISETIGRNPIYIITLTVYCVFICAAAVSPNIGAQLAFRFLAGFFGATPLTLCGGSISDIWTPLERSYSFPFFANAPLLGPIAGPIMGGFIAQSHAVSWRWCEWVTLIASGCVLAVLIFFHPETYPGVLLKWKAQHLRKVTGDERYRAEIEIRQESLALRLRRALYRPFLLTFNEPIVMLVALYLTVVYIVLFTFFDGYSYIYQDIHHISQGLTGVCFVPVGIGIACNTFLVPIFYRQAKRDLAKIEEGGGFRLPPEFRLWYAMLGAPWLTISLFWMGWTDDTNISIWSPLIASVFFGFSIICIFISCYQYIIDSYESFAASALASVTLIRYASAGGMVIVAIPMYENLGVHYTLTVLACISAVLIPVPYVFYKYGYKIRQHSKFAINPS
ncbi:MAG: hypothetical protein M1821_004735 [Bathelium mastoideum]|nr:MAG: hypothetical protein M1821_004735 [Bathelium mastoideum]